MTPTLTKAQRLYHFCRRIWCGLRGHGGVRWDYEGFTTHYHCKRCGQQWSEK